MRRDPEIASSLTLRRRLLEILDVGAYLAHCAVEMIIGHTDGYAMNRNNYRFYHDPVTGRFTIIPHGLDSSFANAAAQVHPPTATIITHAVVATPEGRRRYDDRARQIFTNVFQLTVFSNRVNEATARLKAAARDTTEARTVVQILRASRNRAKT